MPDLNIFFEFESDLDFFRIVGFDLDLLLFTNCHVFDFIFIAAAVFSIDLTYRCTVYSVFCG